MLIYGLKTCDSCRAALKALSQGQLVDVRAEGVPSPVLEAALAQFGHALINTRSTTWRGLDAAEREAAPLTLLQTHPALMKRPLIAVDGKLFLSWNKDIQRDIEALP